MNLKEQLRALTLRQKPIMLKVRLSREQIVGFLKKLKRGRTGCFTGNFKRGTKSRDNT